MFDITPDDISQLTDIDLRELVGRLCEAELVRQGLSPVAVTWGGNQTAADGGLDVRVALPPSASIDGFVPRASTGFQVKTPDMPRAAILSEMRPAGAIRSAIQEIADEAGAYVIVSSRGSTADSALRSRLRAMREAVDGIPNSDQLSTDFYDRTRLATWVRRHAGLITWVKERVGRALVGWRPYGPWTGAAESAEAEYLLDQKLRLHLGRHRDEPAQSVAQVIDELRDELAQAGKIVRLVGLSGVGKTRLVQALFDARIGSRPLPPSLAVYTNLSDNPDPQPMGLASDLIANRMRAVLVVDNCPPDLHGRLSELCSGQNSTVSVITVEYDVRDDQPEGTQVVTLDTSSSELVEKLIRRRYSHLSVVDARTIAEASGGNSRIAIALAETVEHSDTIAHLTNDELFQRLFRQRQDSSSSLLLAAQACSLVFSFQGEELTGEAAELPRLALLAGQSVAETYRHVSELLRRDLVQQRGVWRAMLPHAIANRLAARALEETPYTLINEQLVEGGTERLARSFSRRLSFLHDQPKAVSIVESWLAPGGFLGEVNALSDVGLEMFANVAPVLPEAALAALERSGGSHANTATVVSGRHLTLLRSLAYDAELFERSAEVLSRAATQGMDEGEAKEASEEFISLFPLYLSGTHATIEQRIGVIERLLRSGEAKARSLGLGALDKVLEATHFSSFHQYEFGARSRDFGYQPQSNVEVARWYGAALKLIERLALVEEVLKPELRNLVAQNFRGLWTSALMHGELELLAHRFAASGFWREGWAACRETMLFDRVGMAPDAALRLAALAADLRPSSLSERIRAMVLGDRSGGLDLEEMEVGEDVSDATARIDAIAHELGKAVSTDPAVFAELVPELLRGGNRVWTFARGLAGASQDVRATWAMLVEGLEQIPLEERNVHVLRGFLAEIWEQDRDLAQDFLDSALASPVLTAFLPALHSAVGLDERGVERLKLALRLGLAPVWTYCVLGHGGTSDRVEGGVLRDLLLLIADQPDGFDVALDVLSMRLHGDRSAHREHDPAILEAGRDILLRVTFCRGKRNDYRMASVVKACLANPEDAPIAAEIAGRLRLAVAASATYSSDNGDLLKALLELQPAAVLDALLTGEERDRRAGVSVFGRLNDNRSNPADAISCEALLAWCEEGRESRYSLAASIISFASRVEANGPLAWSDQAKALLANAPDPSSVLGVFVDRFRPMSWSGSRAALIEANAQLLDTLESHSSGLMPCVTEAKAQLAAAVARERQRETEWDRERDERFEE